MPDPALQTFRAPTMAAALAQVKAALGPHAVILHARSFKSGGLFGLGARAQVEITAAPAATNAQRPAQASSQATPGRASLRTTSPVPTSSAQPSLSQPSSSPVASPAIVHAASALAGASAQRAYATPASATPPQPARPRHPLATPAPFAPVDAGAARALHEELASIKKMVTEVLSVSRAVPISSASLAGLVPEPLAALAERLSLAGVDATIVQRIVQGSRSASLRSPADARPAILAALASQLPCRAPEVPERGPASPNRPHVIALVGPTGVGKTTTIAKLAAHFKLRQGLRVGLLTTDTYRIAAVDQLRTYANILGLPLRVVLTPPEVSPALAALRDCDVVLMDNAGRSQNDGARLNDLARFLAAARADQTHLVLSATSTEPVLRKAVEQFRVASPDRLILTKLDEAVQLGVLANLPNHAGLPLALVTTGQEVPDQFRFATPDQIATLVLDGWNSQDEGSEGVKNAPPEPVIAEVSDAEAPVVVVPRRGAAEVRA